MNALVKSAVAKAIQGGEWDPYVILGINRRATPQMIRAAYRKLAKEHHSDVSGDTAAFLLLKEAHDFLMDPASRALWDQKKIRATEQLRKRAVTALTTLFDVVVVQIVESSLAPEFQNLPEMVRKTINETLRGLSANQNEFTRKLKRLRLMEGKTKRKEGAENVATVVIGNRVTEIELVLKKIEDDQQLHNVMLAELDAYSSEAPPQTSGSAYEYFDLGSSSNSSFGVNIFTTRGFR